MSWSHHREPAPGWINSLLSGASTKVIAAIFAAGLCAGIGASWLLISPASPPQVAAESSPPPATTAQSAANDSGSAADPCEQQTWPYVDDKCRAQLAQKSQARRQVRVIATDKSAPSTIVTTPAPPPQSRPVETATQETVGRAPAEAPRPEPVASSPPPPAAQPPAQPPTPAIEGQQTASTARIAPELSMTASISPATGEPAAPPKASTPRPAPTASMPPATAERVAPPKASTPQSAPTASMPQPASTASTPPPSPTASIPQAAPTASTPQPTSNEAARPDLRNDVKAVESDNARSKRSKRADRKNDRQNRTARVRSIPQDGDRDASGATVRTYEMQGGGRVTVYQRGPTMQVGDRVDFGDSPRSRRRATVEPAERRSRYGSRDRDDDLSSVPVFSRGSGEFFFDR